MNEIVFRELLFIIWKYYEINNNKNSHVLTNININTRLTYSDFFIKI